MNFFFSFLGSYSRSFSTGFSSLVARYLHSVSCRLVKVVGSTTAGRTLAGLGLSDALANDANNLGSVRRTGYFFTMSNGGRVRSDGGDFEEWERGGTRRETSC